MMRSCLCAIIAMSVIFTVVGCDPVPPTIQSVRLSTYQRTPQRIFVKFALGGVQYDRDSSDFQNGLSIPLRNCGITSSFYIYNNLSFDSDINKHISSSGADTLLFVQPTMEINGYADAYHAEMTALPAKIIVWEADFRMWGPTWMGKAVSKAIVDRLKTDGILPADCSAPE